MVVTTQLLTLTGSAVQFPAPPTAIGALVTQMLVEPLRSNTHKSYIGTSAVTGDASGTGVIKELAQPPAATVPVDSYLFQDMAGSNTLDPTVFWAQGTNTEKLRITYFQF